MTTPESLSDATATVTNRPALVYIGTDGTARELDQADLATMSSRERALCLALLVHACDEVRRVDAVAAPRRASRAAGLMYDFEGSATPWQGVTPM